MPNPPLPTPFWTNGIATLHKADARSIPLPDRSVHTVVTSPPYWNLRSYDLDDARAIGNETTLSEWLRNIVDAFREVRRVLRPDGTLWLNLGDSYSGSGQGRNPDWDHLPPDHLPLVLETAHAYANNTPLTQRIQIPQKDASHFRESLAQIAPAKGWFLHHHRKTSVQLVLPASELPQIQELADNPTRWVIQHLDPQAAPRSPANTHLVNVRMDIQHQYDNLMPWMPLMGIAAVVTLMATIAAITVAFLFLEEHLKQRKHRGQTA